MVCSEAVFALLADFLLLPPLLIAIEEKNHEPSVFPPFHVFDLGPVCACLAASTSSIGQDADPEIRGLNIALEARVRGEGFGDFTARQTMLLRNREGQKSQRQLRLQVLEVPEDGNKSLFVFDEPRDVQGTALLIYAHREEEDEQWLYPPAPETTPTQEVLTTLNQAA